MEPMMEPHAIAFRIAGLWLSWYFVYKLPSITAYVLYPLNKQPGQRIANKIVSARHLLAFTICYT